MLHSFLSLPCAAWERMARMLCVGGFVLLRGTGSELHVNPHAQQRTEDRLLCPPTQRIGARNVA